MYLEVLWLFGKNELSS